MCAAVAALSAAAPTWHAGPSPPPPETGRAPRPVFPHPGALCCAHFRLLPKTKPWVPLSKRCTGSVTAAHRCSETGRASRLVYSHPSALSSHFALLLRTTIQLGPSLPTGAEFEPPRAARRARLRRPARRFRPGPRAAARRLVSGARSGAASGPTSPSRPARPELPGRGVAAQESTG